MAWYQKVEAWTRPALWVLGLFLIGGLAIWVLFPDSKPSPSPTEKSVVAAPEVLGRLSFSIGPMEKKEVSLKELCVVGCEPHYAVAGKTREEVSRLLVCKNQYGLLLCQSMTDTPIEVSVTVLK